MSRSEKSFPRRQLAADLRNYLRHNRLRLLLVGAYLFALGTIFSVVEYLLLQHVPAFWYGLGAVHATIVAVFVGMVGVMWLASSQRAILLLRGAFGEDNTTDVLKAARRKTIWGYVTSVEVASGDVDHVVVTRAGGVLAIDSKWRNEVTPDKISAMADSARKASRRAELIMRSEQVGTLKRDSRARHRSSGTAYQVRPIVVLWGAEGHRMPASAIHGDVEFVAGPNLAAWLRGIDGEHVDAASARDLLNRLAAFKVRPTAQRRPAGSAST